jgi:phosphatidylglycerophosphatase A
MNKFFVTFFYSGLAPKAPGTFGSLAAMLSIVLFVFISALTGVGEQFLLFGFPLLTLFFCWFGTKSTDKYLKLTGKEDPKEVVIDEVAGMYIAVLLFAIIFGFLIKLDRQFLPLVEMRFAISWLVLLFVFFRFYDIKKPSIVGWADRSVAGGWGVMLDDIFAGIFAALTLVILILGLFYTGLMYDIVGWVNPTWVQ